MEAVQGLLCGIPDWLVRLEELDGQIERRQLELAKLNESNATSQLKTSKSRSARSSSLRRHGSTASLKLPGESEAQCNSECPGLEEAISGQTQKFKNPVQHNEVAKNMPSETAWSGSTKSQDARELAALAQKHVRAILGGSQREQARQHDGEEEDSSVFSVNGGLTAKYRSRSAIIVYYDSYVQSFFEELVKFISTSRGALRKAKMSAKMAHIKRIAELETPDLSEDKPSDITSDTAHEAYGVEKGSAQQMKRDFPPRRGMASGVGLTHRQPQMDSGIFDNMDRGLENVQGLCEQAAHQFLRDGECVDKVERIKIRLRQTKAAISEESDRELFDGLEKERRGKG